VAEARFVAEGHGLARREVMYNDFVLIGPAANPAHVVEGSDIAGALRAIRSAEVAFISRGDGSGTHEAELRLWQDAGGVPAPAQDRWYRAVGQGMGPALNIASASNAYVLADRATWLTFRNKGSLEVLVEGDPRLFNQYSLIVVSPLRHPGIKVAAAEQFVEFLLSAEGQAVIARYTVAGQQLFHPNAGAQ
jgi:tungstate transport system substrate-binding protein